MPRKRAPKAWSASAKRLDDPTDMAEICATIGVGYTPGMALMLRRAKIQLEIEEFQEYVLAGVAHPQYAAQTSTNSRTETHEGGSSPLSASIRHLNRLEEWASELDLELMPYVHARKSANKNEHNHTAAEALIEAMSKVSE